MDLANASDGEKATMVNELGKASSGTKGKRPTANTEDSNSPAKRKRRTRRRSSKKKWADAVDASIQGE